MELQDVVSECMTHEGHIRDTSAQSHVTDRLTDTRRPPSLGDAKLNGLNNRRAANKICRVIGLGYTDPGVIPIGSSQEASTRQNEFVASRVNVK